MGVTSCTNLAPPKNSSGVNSSGANDVIANRPCALSVSRFPSRVGAACLYVESVDLLFAFGVLACRTVDCAFLLYGLLSSKLRCLRLKIELLAFWGPACLRRKKWPTWVRFSKSLARLMILKCKQKRRLFCRDARWRVFVTWLGQLFIMFTVTGDWRCHARCRQIIVLENHRKILPWILWLCYICF